MNDNIQIYYNDTDIAAMLGMSLSWVRGQRFKRKKGEDHWFKLDPIMVASKPKYLRETVDQFIDEQNTTTKSFE